MTGSGSYKIWRCFAYICLKVQGTITGKKKWQQPVNRSRFETGTIQVSSSSDGHINKIATSVLYVELRRALYQSVADATLLTHSQFCGGPTGSVDRRKTKITHTPLMAQSWHFCKNHYFIPIFLVSWGYNTLFIPINSKEQSSWVVKKLLRYSNRPTYRILWNLKVS
jgi:hypothetical protein